MNGVQYTKSFIDELPPDPRILFGGARAPGKNNALFPILYSSFEYRNNYWWGNMTVHEFVISSITNKQNQINLQREGIRQHEYKKISNQRSYRK